ncbi:MAG: prephenate dehydratase [Acidobacteriota bacterium]|nr:prephenate dehydratase [Acidobacteriota bacterium]
MSIEGGRTEIDAIDNELLRLLNERARLAVKVGESKMAAGVSLYDREREREVIDRVWQANTGPLDKRAVVKLFRRIIYESRHVEARAIEPLSARPKGGLAMSTQAPTPRVAFQGERGAFSEEAAVKLLGEEIELVPRPTFESLFAAVAEQTADCALAPIENTLAGSVHRSYDLLLESSLRIVGEVIIPIGHHLIGCPGSSFDEIRTVESHPVALAQCERFFAAHPQIRRVATEDTAGSVAQVVGRGDQTGAAIAGRRAADIYGGTILCEHLEDHRENYTRFVLLTQSTTRIDHNADKLSLVVILPHRPSALHHALEPFARRRIDLLKIESRPIRGQSWQYYFYLDLQASLKDAEVVGAVEELREQALEVRLLGCYPSARATATLNVESA